MGQKLFSVTPYPLFIFASNVNDGKTLMWSTCYNGLKNPFVKCENKYLYHSHERASEIKFLFKVRDHRKGQRSCNFISDLSILYTCR